MKRALSKLATKAVATKSVADSMPKFYAVAKGRDGPKVYQSWDEVR
jgi:viroplasmin and RNaseH domain-containing protein